MAFFEIFLALTIILLVFSIFYYILQKKEYQSQKFKFILITYFIIVFSFFFVNFVPFMSNLNSDYIRYSMINGLSLSTLFLSLTLFIASFYIYDENAIELEIPSLYKSRKGTIEIGRIMKKNRKKRKYFLSLPVV